MSKKISYHVDQVFVAGGLPTVTYVDRASLGLERKIARALALPHNFVTITGASKSGKTTLLHSVVGDRPFVGVDGGQVKDVRTLWLTIADRLSQPTSVTHTTEVTDATQRSSKIGMTAKIPTILDLKIGGEQGRASEEKASISSERIINLQNSCGDFLIKNNVVLVIDDFHHIGGGGQTEIVRNLKNLVFKGLKVIFLSVSYKPYEAIQAESDLAGRVVHVDVPEWSETHLTEIATKGFAVLNVDFPASLTERFATEANGSPQLMQRFCWEACFDLGPKKSLTYDEIRATLGKCLVDKIPNKIEVSNALNNLVKIAITISENSRPLDWVDKELRLELPDPMFRFFLKCRFNPGKIT
jgi:hypothetical protein